MKLVLLAIVCLFAIAVEAQTCDPTKQVCNPQVPLTGKLGPGGLFPVLNAGTITMTSDTADYTMSYPDMSAHTLRIVSSVTLTSTHRVINPQATIGFEFIVQNATTGGQDILFVGATGSGVTIPNGQTVVVMFDGTNYVSAGVFPESPSSYVMAGPPLSQTQNPPAIVQYKICTGLSGGPPYSCTFNNPTQAGSLIFFGPSRFAPAASAPSGVGATTDNLGQVYTQDPSYPVNAAFHKENSAAGVTTVTTIAMNTIGTIVMLEISNIRDSNSYDSGSYQVANIGPNNPITWEPFSISNPGDIVIGYWTCAVPSGTQPTASSPWTLGGYSAASGNGSSGGFVFQNTITVAEYLPKVATADCMQNQQQQAYAAAFKFSLVSTTGPMKPRALTAADVPPTPWSSITNPAPFYLTQIDMGTGATLWGWNLYATNTNQDYGLGFLIFDEAPANPTCYTDINSTEAEPICRSLSSTQSSWSGIWPFEADACGTTTPDLTGFCPGFHVAGDTGNIVLQNGSTVQFPNTLINVASLGTDGNGNVIGTSQGHTAWGKGTKIDTTPVWPNEFSNTFGSGLGNPATPFYAPTIQNIGELANYPWDGTISHQGLYIAPNYVAQSTLGQGYGTGQWTDVSTDVSSTSGMSIWGNVGNATDFSSGGSSVTNLYVEGSLGQVWHRGSSAVNWFVGSESDAEQAGTGPVSNEIGNLAIMYQDAGSGNVDTLTGYNLAINDISGTTNKVYGFYQGLGIGNNAVGHVGTYYGNYVKKPVISPSFPGSALDHSYAFVSESGAGNFGINTITPLAGLDLGGNTTFKLGQEAFASLGTPASGVGTMIYCTDCDAPTTPGSACTSAGGKAGAEAHYIRNAWHCF